MAFDGRTHKEGWFEPVTARDEDGDRFVMAAHIAPGHMACVEPQTENQDGDITSYLAYDLCASSDGKIRSTDQTMNFIIPRPCGHAECGLHLSFGLN